MEKTLDQKKDELLKSFGILPTDETTRRMLVRLLLAGDLGLCDLQTARDITERTGVVTAGAYVFLATLFVARRQGHTFVTEDSGKKLLEECGFLKHPVGGLAKDSLDDFRKDIIAVWEGDGQKAGNQILSKPVGSQVLLADGGRWFFKRDRAAVDSVNKAIADLIGRDCDNPDQTKLTDDEIEKFANYVEVKGASKEDTLKAFPLNAEQRQALQRVFEKRFVVITGGPGTGKTTTVCSILRAFFDKNPAWTAEDIALVAPTACAAHRMEDAIDKQCLQLPAAEAKSHGVKLEKLEGTTLHRLLGGYAPKWKYTAKNQLPKKLVVVDEVSMIDIYLMRALFEALPGDCRLILLGDPDQLPSVDAGAVLGDLARNVGDDVSKGAIVRLKVCNRAQGDVAIVAGRINNLAVGGDAARELLEAWAKDKKIDLSDTSWTRTDFPKDYKGSEFRWCPVAENQVRDLDLQLKFIEKWAPSAQLVEIAKEFYAKRDGELMTDDALEGKMTPRAKKLFDELNRVRILTLVREGKLGVEGLNKMLLKKQHPKMSGQDYLSLPGVPIMVTKNTPSRNLVNGDIGVTVKSPTGMVVLFPRGLKTVVCPVALLPEHELAYAMTVHKSQGSEFEQVLVVLPDDDKHPLLNRQIVYTGITRAKKRAVVMGAEKTLVQALSTRILRNTGVTLQGV